MTSSTQAILNALTKLTRMAIESLDGLATEELNTWKPDGVEGEVNTLFGLATHIAGSGEFWVLEAAGGIDQQRDRPSEFVAEGSLDDIRRRYERWLAASAGVMNSLSEDDLQRVYTKPGDQLRGTPEMSISVADCLVHAVEHTAIHVGHLHVQRQLFDYEHSV